VQTARFPLHVDLRRSRCLSFLMVLLHAVAGGCLWVLPWPLAARCGLLATVGLSAWQALRPSTIVGLRLGEGGELALLGAAGEPVSVTVQADSTVFSQLIVLRVRDEEHGRLRSLVLLPDSMRAEHFRLLRLWLRWLAIPGGPAANGA
jgi:hypothetical protein